MEVNGESIIITDPCYISKKGDWGNGFDFCSCEISSDFGFSDYLFEPTGIGDGDWRVFETNRRESFRGLEKLLWKIYEEDDYEYKLPGEETGEYCADSGMSGVFKLDEVQKYNPDKDIDDLVESGCASLIENFVGQIVSCKDESGELHFIGIRNKSFYTV